VVWVVLAALATSRSACKPASRLLLAHKDVEKS
jgi:hypothetical protein